MCGEGGKGRSKCWEEHGKNGEVGREKAYVRDDEGYEKQGWIDNGNQLKLGERMLTDTTCVFTARISD